MWKDKSKTSSKEWAYTLPIEGGIGLSIVPCTKTEINLLSASKMAGSAALQDALELISINSAANNWSNIVAQIPISEAERLMNLETIQTSGYNLSLYQALSPSKGCLLLSLTKEAGDTSPEDGATSQDSSSHTSTSTEQKLSTGKLDTQMELNEDLASRVDVVRRFMDLNKFQKWDVISLLLRDLEIPSSWEWQVCQPSPSHQQPRVPTLSEWKNMQSVVERFCWRFLTETSQETNCFKEFPVPISTHEPRLEKTSVTYINNKA